MAWSISSTIIFGHGNGDFSTVHVLGSLQAAKRRLAFVRGGVNGYHSSLAGVLAGGMTTMAAQTARTHQITALVLLMSSINGEMYMTKCCSTRPEKYIFFSAGRSCVILTHTISHVPTASHPAVQEFTQYDKIQTTPRTRQHAGLR